MFSAMLTLCINKYAFILLLHHVVMEIFHYIKAYAKLNLGNPKTQRKYQLVYVQQSNVSSYCL